MNGYAVVDLETTGLRPSWHDRVVEIGIVHLSPCGEVEDTWTTLVNPERDLGPQNIHGISAADVLAAPSFADVAGPVAARLRGRTLVAHNAGFDTNFLASAYRSVGYEVPIHRSISLCTMHWARHLIPEAPRTLAGCCAYAGVRLDHHHAALADAEAAAGLLRHYLRLLSSDSPAAADVLPWQDVVTAAESAVWPQIHDTGVECVLRGNATERQVPFLSRLVDSMPSQAANEAQAEYLALLDHALVDRFLSVREQEALVATARDLGIDQPAAMDLHHTYLSSLAQAAWDDGVVTEAEREDLFAVAELLDLEPLDVSAALDEARARETIDLAMLDPVTTTTALDHFRLDAGDLVVFTGQMSEPREVLEGRAALAGLIPHSGVTKKVKLVVAADPDSLSGKARKAAGYGIPIVTEEAFAALLVGVH